ncbi:hypothetical protein C7Y66_14675 [Chroococcidiopsis sp. CCALA 051]|uniref:polymorphic toxin-type HINT domain-containing protein n=1 Tax=Chroococcidiopsis sp. CCALA 051 TaxID=869949 RepID=UPI000D0DBE99|nr:polymorphic toxin-type HINT domain-containing protein [Chroococcidiopsis sp. CCALA 051]PSM48379.1 hypothetical protein C7Y66_14675 [Chroococcidiopsis sp. CCALA 051]
MKFIGNFAKLLSMSLAILLLFFCISDFAYARGGCFGEGTKISTPVGDKLIEQLHPGDRVLSYNFTTHHPEIGKIGEIQVLSSPDYFVINNTLKVTGTHPFYIQTSTGIDLVEARRLKVGDRLVGYKIATPVISAIEYINKPITVYNLISINPQHNFYANQILVHNKGGGGHGGGHGGGGGRSFSGGEHGGGSSAPITKKTIYSLAFVGMLLLAVLVPFGFRREIYNYISFFKKDFTDNLDLIKFTTLVNPNFANRYSASYTQDNEIWQVITNISEINEQDYQHICSKAELIEKVSQLFIQYQSDWTMKKFIQMAEYVAEPFYSKQEYICLRNFGDNYDIVYQPEIIEVAPLSYKQEEDKHIFKIQINAKMTNFEVSPQGYVLSGEPEPRSFTEYWSISIDVENKWYLIGIEQVDS